MKLYSFLFILLMISMAGCVSKRSYENQYLKGESVKPIAVPVGLSSSQIKSAYPVPNVPSKGRSKTIDLIPPGAVKIEE